MIVMMMEQESTFKVAQQRDEWEKTCITDQRQKTLVMKFLSRKSKNCLQNEAAGLNSGLPVEGRNRRRWFKANDKTGKRTATQQKCDNMDRARNGIKTSDSEL